MFCALSSSASSALFLAVKLFFSNSKLFFCTCRTANFSINSSISALSFSSSFCNRLMDKNITGLYPVHRGYNEAATCQASDNQPNTPAPGGSFGRPLHSISPPELGGPGMELPGDRRVRLGI